MAPVLCSMLAGLCSATAQDVPTDSAPQNLTAQPAEVHPRRHSNRLLQLEERITRALKGFSAETTAIQPLGPRMRAPVVRKAPQNKEDEADALEKRDWMLMTPENFAEHEASLELRKMLKEGGMLKSPAIRSEDQWLQDFNRNSSGTRGLVDSMTSGEMQRAPNMRENSTPTEVARTEENLRSLLHERQSAWRMMGVTPQREHNLADAFRQSDNGSSDFRKKEDSYVENYRKFMTPAPVQSFASAVPGMDALADPIRQALPRSGLDAMNPVTSTRHLFTPQLGSINPLTFSRAPLDTTEQAVNQWNKYYVPPPPEPPRSLTPPKPTFEAPRRKF